MSSLSTLSGLLPGRRARITALCTGGGLRRRLLDMGLREGTEVECVGRSPLGSPSAYLVSDALIAIRRSDGDKILIQPLKEGEASWA